LSKGLLLSFEAPILVIDHRRDIAWPRLNAHQREYEFSVR
jgi:hypothetical protein